MRPAVVPKMSQKNFYWNTMSPLLASLCRVLPFNGRWSWNLHSQEGISKFASKV